jgi:hypothetical protein
MPQCRVLVVQPGWLHRAGETPAPQTETPAKIVATGEGEGGEFVVERRLRHEVMAHRIASGNLSAFRDSLRWRPRLHAIEATRGRRPDSTSLCDGIAMSKVSSGIFFESVKFFPGSQTPFGNPVFETPFREFRDNSLVTRSVTRGDGAINVMATAATRSVPAATRSNAKRSFASSVPKRSLGTRAY